MKGSNNKKASVTTGIGSGFKTAEVRLADPIGREVLIDVKGLRPVRL